METIVWIAVAVVLAIDGGIHVVTSGDVLKTEAACKERIMAPAKLLLADPSVLAHGLICVPVPVKINPTPVKPASPVLPPAVTEATL